MNNEAGFMRQSGTIYLRHSVYDTDTIGAVTAEGKEIRLLHRAYLWSENGKISEELVQKHQLMAGYGT